MEIIKLRVIDQSHCSQIRQAATDLARRLGFDEAEAGRVAIASSEIATNLIKHAGTGEVILRSLLEGPTAGVEILSLDRGPGMENVRRCLEDGYSTAGSPGTGLGAMARLSSLFDLYSLPGRGTAVLLRLFSGRKKQVLNSVDLGVVCLPKPGEEVCGDGWAADRRGTRRRVLLADGLGHGPLAALASQKAVRSFRENPSLGPTEMLEVIHGELLSTRGAAVAVAEIDMEKEVLTFAGVGNISAFICTNGDRDRALISHNGTVGQSKIRIQEFKYPCPKGAFLILHSDGLVSRLNLDAYPGLLSRHPGLIAGVLYRDFHRSNDDVTVLVEKEAAA